MLGSQYYEENTNLLGSLRRHTDKFLSKQSQIKSSKVTSLLWVEERQCIVYLLQARTLLFELLDNKTKADRLKKGDLTPYEIKYSHKI